MAHPSTIPGIGKASLELLEAAGFHDLESLAKAGEDELTQELQRANRILHIAERAPSPEKVARWISTAREMTDYVAKQEAKVVMPVDYEKVPEVIAMIAAAPFAIPLPAKVLVAKNLAVADIPAAILLNRYSGDLEVQVGKKSPKTPEARPSNVHQGSISLAEASPSRARIDTSRVKPTDAVSSGLVQPLSSHSPQGDERINLIRGPRVGTNAGRSPESRWFIRGVLHTHPYSIMAGAIACLVLAVLVPAALAATSLLLLSDLKPTSFAWVPKWILVFPLALPLFGISYLIWGRGRCRVCGQKLFIPRMCLKNPKAHHVKFLGYIIPVSFHLLVFK